MSEYVWQHDLRGEGDRLRLMSDLLDPSRRFHSGPNLLDDDDRVHRDDGTGYEVAARSCGSSLE